MCIFLYIRCVILFAGEKSTKFAAVCRQEDFGNGRFVRNVFEQALMRQAQRLCALHEGQPLTKEELLQLTAADFDVAALQPASSGRAPVGFSIL